MDPSLDRRIAEADARHSRRRRRARRFFDLLETIFHMAILLVALGVMLKFLEFIWPYVF